MSRCWKPLPLDAHRRCPVHAPWEAQRPNTKARQTTRPTTKHLYIKTLVLLAHAADSLVRVSRRAGDDPLFNHRQVTAQSCEPSSDHARLKKQVVPAGFRSERGETPKRSPTWIPVPSHGTSIGRKRPASPDGRKHSFRRGIHEKLVGHSACRTTAAGRTCLRRRPSIQADGGLSFREEEADTAKRLS